MVAWLLSSDMLYCVYSSKFIMWPKISISNLPFLRFTYQVANMIRFLVDSYNKPIPAILEIPSKDHPYDPSHDSVLSRVKYLFSAESVASDRR